ncbi:sulfurtransferase TusA family protein [Streptosporangium sp. H16]|uniref:sulfurtransferase TusA family protein n=1 Tax=Streptosporangium sp. H16 TaxID=3444184 RepID=UPI003F78B83F
MRAGPPDPESPAVVVDGGDRSCVMLLLELRRHTDTLPAHSLIHLITPDPAAPVDLAAWCHLTGHSYLGPVPADRPTYALRVSPASRRTAPRAPWHLV